MPIAYPSGQAQWLRELTEQDWVQTIRRDGRRNLIAIARTLMVWATWKNMESRPTWAELMSASGLSARSVARWLLELRLRGWLELLEHGSTPETRPMSLAHLEGNRAALYGLRLPLTPERALAVAGELLMSELATELEQLASRPKGEPEQHRQTLPDQSEGQTGVHVSDQPEQQRVNLNGTLPFACRSFKERSTSGSSRARKPVDNFQLNRSDQAKHKTTALRAGSEEQRVPDLLIMVPVSGYQMLACADELRRRRPSVFGRCSRRLVRQLCRSYWAAGWSNRDILHALDHRPGMFAQLDRGLALPEHLASPRQLIRGRLGAWHMPSGAIRPGYWSSRSAPAATDPSRVRDEVRAAHGWAGVRLLRAGEHSLSAARIAEHGRAARADLATAARSLEANSAAESSLATRAASCAERAEFQARLISQAHAELARRNESQQDHSPTAAGPVGKPGSGRDSSLSTHEAALARAQAEGRVASPRRGLRGRRR